MADNMFDLLCALKQDKPSRWNRGTVTFNRHSGHAGDSQRDPESRCSLVWLPVYTGMTVNSQGILRCNFYPPLRNINRRYPPPSTPRLTARACFNTIQRERRLFMVALKYIRLISIFASFAFFAVSSDLLAQEKLTVSYSSVDAPSANWYIAQEKGFYKKYGMDVESIFIPASSTNVAVLVAGQIKFGNGTGGVIASAAVSGANLVAVACFVNTLPYELIVQESIKSKEQLKGKSIGISRIGSSSDVAARVLLKGLGLEPDKDVAIIQVGGSSERAAAFRT